MHGPETFANWRNVVERLLLLADGEIDTASRRTALPVASPIPWRAWE